MNKTLNFKKPKGKIRKLNSIIAIAGAATVITAGSLFYKNNVDEVAESRLGPYIEQNEALFDSLNQTNSFLEDLKKNYSVEKEGWKNKLINSEKTIVELTSKNDNLLSELHSLESKIEIPNLKNYDSNREYFVKFDNDKIEFSYGKNGNGENVPAYKNFMGLIDVLYSAGINNEHLDLFVTRHDRNYASTITVENLTESNVRNYINTRDELKNVKNKLKNNELSIVNFTFDNGSKQIQYEIVETSKLEDLYSGGRK